MSRNDRIRQIVEAGAEKVEAEELLAYGENLFDLAVFEEKLTLPLPDEPFVACWQDWQKEAMKEGVSFFEVLQRHLPQLCFPIQEGISQSQGYRRASLQGVDPDTLEEATGLPFEKPEALQLVIHQSLAGRIPVLELRGREQFTTMVQALTRRNEPIPVPEAMGAQMVAGFNNWARIREHQRRWHETPAGEREHATWREAFAALREQKELYQDRFILLSDGPYSAIPAEDLGLTEESWREKSLLIRREHECTHYFTRRLFGSMRNNLLDELIADYAGLLAAEGWFRAAWFLRFMGLEERGEMRPGGRIEIYRGDPPLSEGAFRVLGELVWRAAENLERFDGRETRRGPERRGALVAAMATYCLDELASDEVWDGLGRKVEEIEGRIRRG